MTGSLSLVTFVFQHKKCTSLQESQASKDMSCKAHVPFLLNYLEAKSFIACLSYKSYNSCPINAISIGGNINPSNIRDLGEEPTRSLDNCLWPFQKVFLLLQKWWPRVSSHQSATQTRTGPRGRRGCEIQYKQANLEENISAESCWKMLIVFFFGFWMS